LRLLLDEMYAPVVVRGASRAHGHDVVSVHDSSHVHLVGVSDADVLAAAVRDEPVLVTENVRDYRPLESALLAESGSHSGLVYTSNRQFPRGDPMTTASPSTRRAPTRCTGSQRPLDLLDPSSALIAVRAGLLAEKKAAYERTVEELRVHLERLHREAARERIVLNRSG
jgi:hypothetical protein